MGTLSWTESYGEEMFGILNMSQLTRDEAYLNITSTLSSNSYLYRVFKDCYKCPYVQEEVVSNLLVYNLDTAYKQSWRIMLNNPQTSLPSSYDDVLCEFEYDFGEFGVYNLEISNTSCKLGTAKEPVNIYFSILTVILIYSCIGILIRSSLAIWNIYVKQIPPHTSSNQEKDNNSKRVQSLDTFRGISIILMIFVNYQCGGYTVLHHAIWNGLHLADLVFPWFMWIMGVCIPISVSSAILKGVARTTILRNIFKRSAILFLMGIVLGGGIYIQNIRIFGVLQRFAICYLITATVTVMFSKDLTHSYGIENHSAKVIDIFVIRYQWLIAIILVTIHTLVIFAVTVPNCSRGYLGPGGYHDGGRHVNCTGGVTGYIDKVILGNHRFFWPTFRKIYNSDIFDPEGIWGCLTSTVQVIIGIQAGAIIKFHQNHYQRITRWLLWGVLLSLLGGTLCQFSIDGGIIPINKNLWSLSFVCVTSGSAFVLLAICYYLIDVKKFWNGKPFLFAGMNATIMYVGHSLTSESFPFSWIVNTDIGNSTHFLTLLVSVWGTGMWLLIAYYLYKIKYFLSI